MQITGPAPDPLNQKLWGWIPAICFWQAFYIEVWEPLVYKIGRKEHHFEVRDQGYLDSIVAGLPFLHSYPNLQSQGSIYASVQWGYGIRQWLWMLEFKRHVVTWHQSLWIPSKTTAANTHQLPSDIPDWRMQKLCRAALSTAISEVINAAASGLPLATRSWGHGSPQNLRLS